MADGKLGMVGVVGGGVAGLVAAAELARAGAKVVLFEAAPELGGRARTKAADGFCLNQGPHALYIQGAFRRELERLGVEVRGKKTEPVSPQGLWRGKLHRLPASAGSLAATKLFGVREKLQFAGALKAVTDGAQPEGSFGAWLDGLRLRPAVRAGMEALARVTCYANAPYEASAAATLRQMRKGFAGVIYVDGGWTSLIEGLAVVTRKAGAEVRPGARVERVEPARIVLADGSAESVDAVLLAVPPEHAAALAPGVASLAEEARQARPVRMNSLDLALSAWPEGAREFVLGLDQPVYFSQHSKAGRLAPQGGAVVHVAKYVPSGEQVDGNAIAELEALADTAMPGWRKLEVQRQTLRGIHVTGAVVRWDRARPGVDVADAPGLFVAGDWVGEEGMLSDAAAASGAEAARAIAARLSGRLAAA